MNLSTKIKTIRHSNAVAAGTTDIEPANGVDMANFDGVRFIVAFGAIVAGALTSVKAQQSDSQGSGFADLAGTAITVADDDDNQLVVLEIHRPQKRYVRCVVDRGTQNATVDAIIAELYSARKLATADDATTVVGREVHASPAEGTA